MEEKITFGQLASIIKFQKSIIDLAKSTNTKLVYSYTKNNKELTKISTGLDEKLADKRIDLCLTGSNGEILLNTDQSYKFSKEGLRELNAFTKSLYEEEVSFSFMKTKYSDLSNEEKLTFTDLETGEYSMSIQEEEQEALHYIISDFPDNLK